MWTTKPGPTARARKAKRRAIQDAIRECYRLVDLRDRGRSWVSLKPTMEGVSSDQLRRERHHLDRRSTHPERVADPFNVITVTAAEAEHLDAHRLIPVDLTGCETHDTRLIAGFAWNGAPGADITVETLIPLTSRIVRRLD